MSKKNKKISAKSPKSKDGGKNTKKVAKTLSKSKKVTKSKPAKIKQSNKAGSKKTFAKKVIKSKKPEKKNVKADKKKSVTKGSVVHHKEKAKKITAKNKIEPKKVVKKVKTPPKDSKPLNKSPQKSSKEIVSTKVSKLKKNVVEMIHEATSDSEIKKTFADKKHLEVLAVSNTIPVQQKVELSASKIASISSTITNPQKKLDSYSVKSEREPVGKMELEFVIHASAEMLYEFISTPSGLSEWFCDDLNVRNGIYTFIWEDQMQQARLLKTIDNQLVRFQWVDKLDGSYFEMRIQRDELTNDISLIITDFAESSTDHSATKMLWQNQIEKLMHVIGAT